MSPKRLVRTPELSRYLRISPRTLEKWRAAGQGPPFLKSGGALGSHQHGSASDGDVLIPMLLSGAGALATGLNEASILDVAPTALWALGLRPPAQYEGRVLFEAFH